MTVEPGEYLCEWKLPVSLDGELSAQVYNGSIELGASKSPTGRIVGYTYFWEVEPTTGQMSRSLPNVKYYDTVRCRLIDRSEEVVLFNVQISDSFGGEAIDIDAAAALVGVDLPAGDDPQYLGMEIQVTALDAVGGRYPIRSVKRPESAVDWHGAEWSVKGNEDIVQRWTSGEMEVRHEYNLTARIFDPYDFRVRFSPVLRVNRTAPQGLDYWVDTWINPLRTIISAATGREEEITFVHLFSDLQDVGIPSVKAQLFARGVSQRPYFSSNEVVRKLNVAFSVSKDRLSLLEAVERWNAGVLAGNPLLQTYNPRILSADQHPRGRFLYVIQCLEGLDGFERKDENERRLRAHRVERHDLIATIKSSAEALGGSIEAKHLKFARANVGKRPSDSLAACLKRMIEKLPDVGVQAEIADLSIVVEAMSSLSSPPSGALDAIRIIRNDLAHGNRDYPPRQVGEAAELFYRVVRAHLLRLLGCGDEAQKAALRADR